MKLEFDLPAPGEEYKPGHAFSPEATVTIPTYIDIVVGNIKRPCEVLGRRPNGGPIVVEWYLDAPDEEVSALLETMRYQLKWSIARSIVTNDGFTVVTAALLTSISLIHISEVIEHGRRS